jgi:hypothetical protein
MTSREKELVHALRQLLKAYDSLMPGLAHIAVQDYALINRAPLEARMALSNKQAEEMISEIKHSKKDLSVADRLAIADRIAMQLQSAFRILYVKPSGSAKHAPSTNQLVHVICLGIEGWKKL